MNSDSERLVSIVIPVYRARDTLRECVSSCAMQKDILDKKLQIILVDDGSDDGSSEICDELALQYPGVVEAVHGKNCGVSHARNIGLERAVGRFVTFVDADDRVTDKFVKNMLSLADEKTFIVAQTQSFSAEQKISGFQFIENVILASDTHVWGKLFDRQILAEKKIRFREGLTIGEDLLFLIDAALSQGKEHTIKCAPAGDYIYNDNPEGAMKRAFKESYMDELLCWKEAERKLYPHNRELSAYAYVSLAASRVMTALLVVGKVAVLKESERDEDLCNLAVSRAADTITEALKVKGTFAGLSAGYKVKVLLFKLSPGFYMKLYGKHKNG
ncbi:MAG: glycosyltransferase family 2 protein [Butyrivibrio sp.]|nr:glycosyltransferase family 2 protein [Butyrivibrio sp.]